jgi:hypothetical protein
MKLLKDFGLCLINRELMPTALKVALIVGSILFTINHGSVFLKGQMNRERWISAILTYIVPYCVNIHGQSVTRSKQNFQS